MSSLKQQTTEYSLYIPTINKKYSAEMIINMFWQFFMGNVDRIDFVPIMKQPKDTSKEPIEDPNFWQAFLYVRPRTTWATFVTDAIDNAGSYKFYPNQNPHPDPEKQGSPKEYWIILKNKTPVPYAQTHLNVHQLAHNNSLLETKVSEMETKFAEMEAEMLKMKSKMEEMVQDVARLQYDNDTMSMQLEANTKRERCDSHSTTESDAEAFVNSWENILRMAEEQQGIFRDENGRTSEDRQRMYEIDDNDGREREEDLVYDDSGEMTQKGRIVKTDNHGNTYYYYEMLDVDGYNNGDVAPRGDIAIDIKDIETETCSECGFKGELFAYGWRHADDNLCRDCANLPGMDAYEC
jgi:regulator of replication initiation timing